MQNYNFESLNDKEFEVLVNDLLSKKESVDVDRFKPGKDGGIDGRFFITGNQEVVIQSKHWLKSGINPLIARLKKEEVAKVKKIDPKRYILATSLTLSKANKQKIKAIFEPYIISEDDILGQENLNDLLGKYSDIEKKHYKLWLSSSNVLQAMLNTALTGRSEAKRDDIIQSTKMYVVTQNHSNALDKLENLHSVVITGEAGIGKTSLADQLAHHYIARDYELCVIEDDISEAESNFAKEKKQIFYFDDFLGRNYLMAIEGHKDSHVLNFIERIGKDKTKRFILTSRSTVLKQGKLHSDLLDLKKINQKEYEITIQSLSVLDRAKILYNHIWYSELSEEHFDALYVDQRYLKIAKHRNFNPRLISFITDPDKVLDVKPEDYWDYVSDNLENPHEIWANVFDNQIDELTRIAVCLIVFNGSNMKEVDLRASFTQRALADKLISASNAPNKYANMSKIAVGSMLRRTIRSEPETVQLGLFNPSVADFVLGRYLKEAESLSAYFLCLNTTISLRNLKSLKENSGLEDSVYYAVLKELAVRKIDIEFYINFPEYFLRLIHMIITDPKAISFCDIPLILECAKSMISGTVPQGFVDEVSDILEFSLIQSPQDFREIAANFIVKAVSKSHGLIELVRLEKLRQNVPNLKAKANTKLQNSIRDEAVSHWEEEASQEIIDSNILDGYLHEHEEDDAYNDAYEYIDDSLSAFDVPADMVASIAETLDIAGILEENLDAENQALRDTYGGRAGSKSSPSDNTDSLVDDLFERD